MTYFSLINRQKYKGLTPVEVMVYCSCEKKCDREEVLKEINERAQHPSEIFNTCLEVLKRRGLIVY